MDYAHVLRDLADTRIPACQDHCPGPGQPQHPCQGVALRGVSTGRSQRLAERFEWHYTPKHGSWLDLAESELAVLSSQCLDRRIPDKQILIDEVGAWEHDRNANHTKSDWHFTTADARIKLKHLYPSI